MTRHNKTDAHLSVYNVVNCFQKLLSSWHDTTLQTYCRKLPTLWIAFKNYYLRDTTQLSELSLMFEIRCELLSKIIIFVTRHNWTVEFGSRELVVNCFQKLLSSWHDTTKGDKAMTDFVLWIAFKNYYLRDTTQRPKAKNSNGGRCELLSKIIIFVTRHN